MLTPEQIKDIADDLEALSYELGTRNWDAELAGEVMTRAAASLVSVAAMRAPVYPPQPYPYSPEDAPLAQHFQVSGSNRNKLEDLARLQGVRFFRTGDLEVRLTGTVTTDTIVRDDCEPPAWRAQASVRLRQPERSRGTRDPDVPLG